MTGPSCVRTCTTSSVRRAAPVPSPEKVVQRTRQRAQVGAPPAAQTEPVASPEQVVQRAWRRAQEAGVYHFTTEIVQTTYPAPAVVNVGRSPRKESLHFEGGVEALPTPSPTTCIPACSSC